MEKILITGGAGFIGSHLSNLLLKEGFRLVILDPLSPQIHGSIPQNVNWLSDEKIEFIRGSINVRSDVESALKDVKFIVHLAAETGTGQSMYKIDHYNYVNSQGLALLLDVLSNNKNHRVKRIILTSSRSVYGEGAYACSCCNVPPSHGTHRSRVISQLKNKKWDPICQFCKNSLTPIPTRENDLTYPASIYAATKLAQEDLLRIFCDSMGIDYAILRLQNVYGEGQSLNNPYTGILSIFSTRIRHGLGLRIFEDGLESRDFIHVSDVTEIIKLCLLSPKSINTIINVGSGIATSVMEIAEKLSVSLGAKPDISITGEYRIGDIRHNFADIQRLQSLLDYTPKVSIEQGLNCFSKWVKTQSLPADLLETANAELRAHKLMEQ